MSSSSDTLFGIGKTSLPDHLNPYKARVLHFCYMHVYNSVADMCEASGYSVQYDRVTVSCSGTPLCGREPWLHCNQDIMQVRCIEYCILDTLAFIKEKHCSQEPLRFEMHPSICSYLYAKSAPDSRQTSTYVQEAWYDFLTNGGCTIVDIRPVSQESRDMERGEAWAQIAAYNPASIKTLKVFNMYVVALTKHVRQTVDHVCNTVVKDLGNDSIGSNALVVSMKRDLREVLLRAVNFENDKV